MEQALTATSRTAKSRGRWWFLLGIGLLLLGIVIFIVQSSLRIWAVPWYAPILATLGVLLAVFSVLQRRSVTRGVGLVLLALLCAGEWHFLIWGSKLPAYSGPVQAGQTIPHFETTLADGRLFTDADLRPGAPGSRPEVNGTVLVFFRGRW